MTEAMRFNMARRARSEPSKAPKTNREYLRRAATQKAIRHLRQQSEPQEKLTPQQRQAEREIVVTLRLPRELHARLKELGGERGLTAQIRQRLEASFAAPDEAGANEQFR